jgi:hypothetical protein
MKKLMLIAALMSSMLTASSQSQLQTGFCNYTAKSFGEIVYADAIPGANKYRFQFVNAATSYNQVWTNPGTANATAFFAVPGISTGLTYTVTVATSNDGGSTWSAYGSGCDLTAPGDYTTTLEPGDCGVVLSSWTQLIRFYPMIPFGSPSQSQYQVRLTNASLGFSQTNTKYGENFNAAQFNLQPNTTYTVEVRSDYPSAWSNWGPPCTITTPAPPTTSLQPGYCGYTALAYDELIFAENSISNQYRFKLVNMALGYSQTFDKSNANFNLTQFTGLQHNTTYSVSVAVFFAGSYGPFGPVCQLTTPPAPTSFILPGECGGTASSYTSQIFHAQPVTGFDCYFYNFTDGVNTYTLEKCNNNNFILDQLSPALPVATTFTVTVKVQYGGSYGPFGSPCTITTPGSYMRLASPSPYPNPFTQSFNLEASQVKITDASGNIKYQGAGGELGTDLQPGIYYIHAGEQRMKVIKN